MDMFDTLNYALRNRWLVNSPSSDDFILLPPTPIIAAVFFEFNLLKKYIILRMIGSSGLTFTLRPSPLGDLTDMLSA